MSFRVISVKSLDPAKDAMKEMRRSFLRKFSAETAESFRMQIEKDFRADQKFPPDNRSAIRILKLLLPSFTNVVKKATPYADFRSFLLDVVKPVVNEVRPSDKIYVVGIATRLLILAGCGFTTEQVDWAEVVGHNIRVEDEAFEELYADDVDTITCPCLTLPIGEDEPVTKSAPVKADKKTKPVSVAAKGTRVGKTAASATEADKGVRTDTEDVAPTPTATPQKGGRPTKAVDPPCKSAPLFTLNGSFL